MRPLVIEYLKTHTFRQLEEEHGINARPNKLVDKFSLNYDQIMAKPSDPVANQCRGLIVRPAVKLPDQGWEDVVVGDVEILAWPMHRFFNLGDTNAARVDWSDQHLHVLDKLDGTCCIVYWDEQHEKWHCATRSVSEADLPIKGDHLVIGNMTFSELFMRTFEARWAQTNSQLVGVVSPYSLLNKRWTYVFELTSPYNKIVVKYDEPSITLLAARDLDQGWEVYVNSPVIRAQQTGIGWVARPKSWNINNQDKLTEFLNAQDPTKCEGAVVCDTQFNRVKIKSTLYLMSFKMKDMLQLSRRSVLESVLVGQIDDVIPHLDLDLAKHVIELQNKLREYFVSIDKNFRTWKEAAGDDRKTFARLVQESDDWHVPYYAMFKGQYSSVAE